MEVAQAKNPAFVVVALVLIHCVVDKPYWFAVLAITFTTMLQLYYFRSVTVFMYWHRTKAFGDCTYEAVIEAQLYLHVTALE